MTAALNHALEAAIRHAAYELGRVDQSIGVAADELRRMVEADPDIRPGHVLRLYGFAMRWSNIPDWNHVLWALANVWCEVYRKLQERPARPLPASPYSDQISGPGPGICRGRRLPANRQLGGKQGDQLETRT